MRNVTFTLPHPNPELYGSDIPSVDHSRTYVACFLVGRSVAPFARILVLSGGRSTAAIHPTLPYVLP